MTDIEVCGNDLDWCSRDKCIVYINGYSFDYWKFGEFVETSEAPDYGCASFEFAIDDGLLETICNKFKLIEEEKKLIRDSIASNWWGSSCAMCE